MATPEGWHRASLRDVTESIVSGQSPNCETRPAEHGEWGILKTTAVTWERGWNPNANKAVLPDFVPRSDLTVAAGDVLITKAGPVERVGVCAFVDRAPPRLMVSGKIARIRSRSALCDPAYLARALSARDAQSHLVQRTTGMAVSQTNFTHEALLSCPVLVPPLGEQRKIAAILSSIDDTIEKTAAVIAQLEVVKKAMMQELLTRGMPGRHTRFKHTEIGEIPEGWSVRRVSDVALRVTDGTHQTPTFTDSGVPFLLVRSISRGFVDWTACKYVDASTYEALTKRCRPERGDVLYTAVGATYGVAVVVDRDDPFTFQRHVALIKPKNGLVDADFLALAINSPAGRRQSDVAAVGNAQPTVTLGSLSAFVVPTPSLDEQKDIARVCHSFDRRLVQEAECLRSLRLCKVALASALLSGDLRVTPAEAAP
jgi:type I restriction enzyme S subunit